MYSCELVFIKIKWISIIKFPKLLAIHLFQWFPSGCNPKTRTYLQFIPSLLCSLSTERRDRNLQASSLPLSQHLPSQKLEMRSSVFPSKTIEDSSNCALLFICSLQGGFLGWELLLWVRQRILSLWCCPNDQSQIVPTWAQFIDLLFWGLYSE